MSSADEQLVADVDVNRYVLLWKLVKMALEGCTC